MLLHVLHRDHKPRVRWNRFHDIVAVPGMPELLKEGPPTLYPPREYARHPAKEGRGF
jgi:hypothetical protein